MTKREKQSLKKKALKEEYEFARLVDDRFEAFNVLIRDGELSQDMLVLLREQAIQDNNLTDKQVCDMFIL